MDDRTLTRIFDWLNRLQARSLTRTIGIIDTTTSPGDVITTIAGVAHYNLSCLTSYTPSDGDRVYVIRSGRDLTVIGEVA